RVRDAQQRRDVSVAARLRQDTARGVDQYHGQIGGRGAGGHVAGVLLVAGRIGDDEFALGRLEIAVGDVDGNSLLALGAQTVGKQRKVDGPAGAVDAALADGGQLILVDRLRVVQQTADQGGLAIVYTAGGGEAQHVFVEMLLHQ